MNRSRALLAAVSAAAVLAATLAYGQEFGQRFGRRFIEQNVPPATEFVAARWHFGTNGYIGHMGWSHTALTCMQEMYVPGSLPMCVRVLMHVNTAKSQRDVKFVYLRGAKALRPDITD